MLYTGHDPRLEGERIDLLTAIDDCIAAWASVEFHLAFIFQRVVSCDPAVTGAGRAGGADDYGARASRRSSCARHGLLAREYESVVRAEQGGSWRSGGNRHHPGRARKRAQPHARARRRAHPRAWPADDGKTKGGSHRSMRAEAVRQVHRFRRVQVETLREDWPEKRKPAEARPDQ